MFHSKLISFIKIRIYEKSDKYYLTHVYPIKAKKLKIEYKKKIDSI